MKKFFSILLVISLLVVSSVGVFAYGSFDQTIYNYLNNRVYTNEGKTYDVKIFKSNPSTQFATPVLLQNGYKSYLSSINPSSSYTTVAKVNGNVMQSYGSSGTSFYGLGYVNGVLYQDGKKLNSASDVTGLHSQYYPCFVVKNNDTATVRWFSNTSALSTALPYIKFMMPSTNCLVYDSKSVFESTAVYDEYDGGLRIADWNNLSNPNYHNNYNTAVDHGTSANTRTFIGHKKDGSFILVVVDSTGNGMNFKVGAQLMVDLECDYAVNLDGSDASQMRVASGYTNGATAGKVTTNGSNYTYYGSAFCIYNK
ncbi:MAG: phosphodiester glycosidase family protein [Clostridia bacterium]|nr:phosphodiester glycosidase family protein [Clostridia bacterium]